MSKNNDTSNQKQCAKCTKFKNNVRCFYRSFSEWHGDGFQPYCKDCLKEKIKEDNEAIVKNVLRIIDRPYKPSAWKKAMEDKNDTLGTYIKNLNLNAKYETWDDSDFHQMGEINLKENTPDEFVDEEKVYSKKWLGYYKPSEMDYLEDYIRGLDRDFRIVTLSHRDYAMKIAKASLHMDKCFQEMQDGVPGSDKRYREAKEIFDTLSKSAKFSESQRGITDVGMGSISQIVEMVESETYVYEHKNDLDKDMYDKLLEDFKHINKSL